MDHRSLAEIARGSRGSHRRKRNLGVRGRVVRWKGEWTTGFGPSSCRGVLGNLSLFQGLGRVLPGFFDFFHLLGFLVVLSLLVILATLAISLLGWLVSLLDRKSVV